ncbi:hypothetical protein DVH24_002306, partial [Malus domestica]
VALTSPRPVDTATGSTTAVKRAHPLTKETGVIAQPSKWVKRMAKKKEHEILTFQPHLLINSPLHNLSTWLIRHDIILIEAVADSTATAPLSNPKITIVPFILDEEDDDDEPSLLVRCLRASE